VYCKFRGTEKELPVYHLTNKGTDTAYDAGMSRVIAVTWLFLNFIHSQWKWCYTLSCWCWCVVSNVL